MDVFQSLEQMIFVLLPYVSCYYTETLQLQSILPNHLVCYDSMLKGLSKELTLVLSDTRELNRVPNTK